MGRIGTSIIITDPLVKYHSLVSAGLLSPDLAQHRLAHHLQKIYERLKDYSPQVEYRTRLQEVTRALQNSKLGSDEGEQLAVDSHPIWRNPFFSSLLKRSRPSAGNGLSLTRVLTSHQAALDIDSPKGFFLSGEVGTGKSMLLDLLAEGLPNKKKRRWHFNTFMLHAFSKLEHFRKSQGSGTSHEYSLLWLASELVESSPILFLDEFQLPDRAAAKLLNNLFVAFFQLGGVLVASSNRMPEELEKATGGSFRPPPTGGLLGQMLGLGRRNLSGELHGQTSDFAAFLEVLKARCDFWHMEGARDWRRREIEELEPVSHVGIATESQTGGTAWNEDTGLLAAPSSQKSSDTRRKPAKYSLLSEREEGWQQLLPTAAGAATTDIQSWQGKDLVVYGRTLLVPRQENGVSFWQFSELVRSFGPADYLSLTSTYHTFVVDGVPTLTASMKNEARRFITFLDALYEARCKLIIVRAEAGPDDLFFPDARKPAPVATTTAETSKAGRQQMSSRPTYSMGRAEDSDAVYSETIAEVYQDQTSPFRPNISDYSSGRPTARYDADQDSDFEIEKRPIDFANAGAFTGEDERFAYRRAASRLWELCSERWHARPGDWWCPLPPEARHWEQATASKPLIVKLPSNVHDDVDLDITFGPLVELDGPAGLERHRVEAPGKAALKK